MYLVLEIREKRPVFCKFPACALKKRWISGAGQFPSGLKAKVGGGHVLTALRPYPCVRINPEGWLVSPRKMKSAAKLCYMSGKRTRGPGKSR